MSIFDNSSARTASGVVVWAGLVGVLCCTAVTSRVPAARAADAQSESVVASLAGDALQPPPPSRPSRVARAEVSGAGFNTLDAGPGYVFVNVDAMTIRLVSTGEGDVEALRTALQSAANQVRSISGVSLRVAPGTVPDVAGDRPPRIDEIAVSVDSTSPCGSGTFAGCGNPRIFQDRPDSGTRVIRGGRIWIHPQVLSYSAVDLSLVVSHEMGHALGLAHFNEVFEGSQQVMNGNGNYAVGPTYRSGDANGLRFLHPRPPPPANDSFAAATTIAGWSGRTVGTNTSATRESGEPQHGRRAGGASVWYRWRAPAAGVATFNTFGSAFDTVLAVYRGGSVGGLTRVAANDNFAGSQSQVTFATRRSVTYRIAIDGATDEFGVIHLRYRRA